MFDVIFAAITTVAWWIVGTAATVAAVTAMVTILWVFGLYKSRRWLWVHLTVQFSLLFWGPCSSRAASNAKIRANLDRAMIPRWYPLFLGTWVLWLNRQLGFKA